jgi:hypothetical protein
MNGKFQMQGGKNWIFPKEVNANRFFWDSHWLEIWSNHFCPSLDSVVYLVSRRTGNGISLRKKTGAKSRVKTTSERLNESIAELNSNSYN